jgi:hypothetical protein
MVAVPLFFIITFSFVGCIDFGGATFLGNRSTASSELPIAATGNVLIVSGAIAVELVNGSNLTALTQSDLFERYLEINRATPNVLVIRPKSNFRPPLPGSLVLRVGVNAFNIITLNTDQPFNVAEPLLSSNLDLRLGGSTRGRLESRIDQLILTINTPYRIDLVGRANNFTLNASSVARLNQRGFVAEVTTDNSSAGAINWQ